VSSSPNNKKIGFIGTGLMGQPMATKLLEAGFKVTVWNRTAEKSLRLADTGASVASSLADCVRNADVVITMLTDDTAVATAIFESGAYLALPKNSVMIDMSSITPNAAKANATLCKQARIHYLDAPVSGGTGGAQAGTLAIMVGGDKATYEQCEAVFKAMGKPTLVGPNGSGQLAKLCNQLIVGITIGAVAEAMLLAEQGGADLAAMRAALMGGFADSKILKVHGERMLNRDFEPGAMSSLQLKDMKNIVNQASGLNLTLPLSSLVQNLYQAHIDSGGQNLDHSSLLLQIETLNNIVNDQ
jgi:2-hydroxy-3-oxopropionate reductase